MGAAVREIGIGFLFAPAVHPAVKHVQQARTELKMRTAFNLLGPLTNPAGANVQVVGAFSPQAAELLAAALASLGLQRGFIVHGHDGLDEITTTTETLAFEIRGGAIAQHMLSPSDFGVPRATAEKLKAEDRAANRAIALAVLSGEKGAWRDIVLVNTSAALVAAGAASDFRQGVEMAAESIDSGAAMGKLRALAQATTQTFSR
jgi:anthranilate phosphoribosyltransferase